MLMKYLEIIRDVLILCLIMILCCTGIYLIFLCLHVLHLPYTRLYMCMTMDEKTYNGLTTASHGGLYKYRFVIICNVRTS